jgi:uroporphyrinogen III methyltransferase/synthase
MEIGKKDARHLSGLKVGAIGPATADALRHKGIIPDLVPSEYRAEAVVEALGRESLENVRILLPRAAEAREILPIELEKMGAFVDVIPAYRTVRPDRDTTMVRDLLVDGRIDLITFTSSSTVSNFLGMFPGEDEPVREWMKKTTIACIGPITAETAEKNGLTVSVMPDEYTIDGLTDSIIEHFTGSE